MRRLILQRLLLSLPLPFIVSGLTFVMVALTPGDVAQSILGGNATRQQYLAVRRQLGLDEPLWSRYGDWLSGAVRGDFGNSLVSGESVTSLLDARLGPTLSLVIGSTLLATVAGMLLGLVGALRGGLLGRIVDASSLVGLALPNFWLGLMLISWFAVALRWLPTSGYVPLTDSVSGWFSSLVLPVVTLAAPGTAMVAKQARDAVRDTMQKPFMRTLRAAGLSRRSLLLRHMLRNAAVPVVTVMGLLFVGALSGTVIAESVFAIPGLGGTAQQATVVQDVPLVLGVAVYFTLIVIVVNLLVDIAYGWLDPKVRVS
ncbi:ABC transporter permease [Streptomyces sp. NPDC091217]|uniref:ABC transporter permease n=1 Tax=Streptomyces sp. NPDC091217 TaxID=3365975 RepID=UPI0037F65E50